MREWPRRCKDNTNTRFTDLLRKQMRLVRTAKRELDALPTAFLHLPLKLDERRHDISALNRDDQGDLALSHTLENPLGFALAVPEEKVPESSDLGADARAAGVDGDMDSGDGLEDCTLGKLVRGASAESNTEPSNEPAALRGADADGSAVAVCKAG